MINDFELMQMEGLWKLFSFFFWSLGVALSELKITRLTYRSPLAAQHLNQGSKPTQTAKENSKQTKTTRNPKKTPLFSIKKRSPSGFANKKNKNKAPNRKAKRIKITKLRKIQTHKANHQESTSKTLENCSKPRKVPWTLLKHAKAYNAFKDHLKSKP